MITQYSRVQLTLSEKEKEYAWFSYAAKIIRAGCNDQQMSGYTVTGTGIDGQEIKAELTNEELFQLFFGDHHEVWKETCDSGNGTAFVGSGIG